VSNCAIHNGWGIGMEIKFAENILVKDNNFYSFYKYGINIVTSKNITLDGNYVFVTLWRHLEASTAGDPTAAIAACGH
jgi:parallel beta-helix repeat protein